MKQSRSKRKSARIAMANRIRMLDAFLKRIINMRKSKVRLPPDEYRGWNYNRLLGECMNLKSLRSVELLNRQVKKAKQNGRSLSDLLKHPPNQNIL